MAVGSYPVSGEKDGATVLLSLDSREEKALKEAQALLEAELDSTEIVGIDYDQDRLVPDGCDALPGK